MKIRKGFVSNSSSSSFILCAPKDINKKNIKKLIQEKLKIEDINFIPNFKKEVLDAFMKYLKKNLDLNQEELEYWIDDEKMLKQCLNKEIDVYTGGFSDNGEGDIQYLLCGANLISISEKDFYFKHRPGY
ncbi:MAG TPA: hypothetical protein VMZ91_12665 [Candidatus Paceibacterota bacterium]|nr:hypothetical protein [Candidatus Paceibacterota bacterium]